MSLTCVMAICSLCPECRSFLGRSPCFTCILRASLQPHQLSVQFPTYSRWSINDWQWMEFLDLASKAVFAFCNLKVLTNSFSPLNKILVYKNLAILTFLVPLVVILKLPWNCFSLYSIQFECIFLEVWHVRKGRGSWELISFCPVKQGSWFPMGLSASMSQHLLPNLASWIKNPNPQIMFSVILRENMLAFWSYVKEKKSQGWGSCFFQWIKNLLYQRLPVPNWMFCVVQWTQESLFGFGRGLCRRRKDSEKRKTSGWVPCLSLKSGWAQTFAHIKF